jgi:hypothetical protein
MPLDQQDPLKGLKPLYAIVILSSMARLFYLMNLATGGGTGIWTPMTAEDSAELERLRQWFLDLGPTKGEQLLNMAKDLSEEVCTTPELLPAHFGGAGIG